MTFILWIVVAFIAGLALGPIVINWIQNLTKKNTK